MFSFNIEERYLLIGPAYDVYVNGTPSLEVTLIDSDIITIYSEASIVIDAKLLEETLNTYVNILFASQDSIFNIHSNNRNFNP